MVYNTYPAVDENYDFPPEIVTALNNKIGHFKGNLPAGATLDSLSTGWYYVFAANNDGLNLPKDVGGLLEIARAGAGGIAILTSTGDDQPIYKTERTTNGWVPWKQEGSFNGLLADAATKDGLKNGTYWTTASTANSVLDINKSGRLDVFWWTSSIGMIKLTTGQKNNSDRWIRIRDVNGWGEWHHAEDASLGGSRHQMRKDDMIRRRGGIKPTDRAVVKIRYDHGLANFMSDIWPIHTELNLPCTMALSSRQWGAAENAGVTQSQMNSLPDTLIEYANHSANGHAGAPTELGWIDDIENGRKELQAQLPAHTIDTFIVSGTGGVGWGGFVTGASLDEFQSRAGQFILSQHALVSGALPDPGGLRVPLDGEIHQGLRHLGFGNSSLSSFQSSINQTINEKRGITIMMHPSQLNTTGWDTTAQLRAKLEWLSAQRAAGRIHIETMRDGALYRLVEPAGYGDTGRRELSFPEKLSGFLRVQRTGKIVQLTLSQLKFVAGTPSGLTLTSILPVGFRPKDIYQTATAPYWGTDTNETIRVTNSGSIVWKSNNDASQTTLHTQWITDDPWPVTLPGTAV